MPNAYEELMGAVKKRVDSGAHDKDLEKDKRKKDEERKRAQEEERRRQEREGKNATGARVRQGFTNLQEMREAIRGERAGEALGAPKAKKPNLPGGVRG